MRFQLDIHYRLQPREDHQAGLQRGFMAEIADPAWFVGRQWQMGEHQGENAASPVLTRVTYGRRPLQPSPGRPGQFPGHGKYLAPPDAPPITAAEAIVEGEPDEWWTIGRRIRIGLAAQVATDAILAPDDRAEYRLPPLPEPYDGFGGYDGRALYRAFRDGKLNLEPALFAEAPQEKRSEHWLPAELKYGKVEFPVDARDQDNELDPPRLVIEDHDGGEVEWWTADAAGDWSAPIPEALKVSGLEVQPARFSYPGAPHPRWWQIENAQVDIGGFPPDQGHFATMLLLDFLLSHSDDWFTLPLAAQIGDVLTIEDLVVVDLFREEFSFGSHPQLKPPTDWSLFKVRDLDAASIVLWPGVDAPVAGVALEEIALGVDEDANLLWAVEERAEGLRLSSLDIDPPAKPVVEPNPKLDVITDKDYLYRPSTFVPHHWHPYVIEEVGGRRTFVQGRFADYTAVNKGEIGRLAPEPVAELLQDPTRKNDKDPMHQINPAVVPVLGLRLDRRYVLARRTDGAPILWVQRRRLPLSSPPVSGLRFDVLD